MFALRKMFALPGKCLRFLENVLASWKCSCFLKMFALPEIFALPGMFTLLEKFVLPETFVLFKIDCAPWNMMGYLILGVLPDLWRST